MKPTLVQAVSRRAAAEEQVESFAADVLRGLSLPRKRLSSKCFYDERGAVLFDRICELDEYYVTRTELGIMRRHAGSMAACIGADALVVELGSGSGIKTRLMLDHLRRPAAYMPVDIARDQLFANAASLARDYPGLDVVPIHADFTDSFPLPSIERPVRRCIVYFPGSTIGNLDEPEMTHLLHRLSGLTGRGGGLLIGFDLKKDPAVLHAAYNDASGVTAEFNRNLLHRINRELEGDFAPGRFDHYAFYNPHAGRIEMHLLSREAQIVSAAGQTFAFRASESIHTENSYKYDADDFASRAGRCGFVLRRSWSDDRTWFVMQYYETR